MDAPLDRPLAPGDLVGRYRIEAFVAEGGMGRVYRAWDLMLDRAVALKTIRGDLAGDRQVMNRFHREAQLLAKLDHPGICHVYDWLDHHGTLVMAMEWVEGTPLSTLLEGGPLPIQQAARLLREVALALASAHAKGVIHRDLKPSNICLTEGGSAKLLDFGLATVQGEALALETRTGWLGASGEASTMPCTAQENRLTQSGAILGTRGYMAPELLMGEPASAAADLYALGVVASMLLTGSKDPSGPGGGLPWVRQSLERRSPSGHHPSGPIPTLPNALWHLVDDLLSLSPPARPSAQAVVQTLDRMLAPRSPVWWSSATAILTLALVALGLWAYGRGAIPEFSRTRHARLVVVPVQNHTGSASLGTAVEITTTELLEYVLRAFPQVEVVRDGPSRDTGVTARQSREDRGEAPERDFLRRLVARTGADLVLTGDVSLDPGTRRPILRVRVLNPNGDLRVSRETSSSGLEYEPNRSVPAVLRQLDRTFSPLGRPGDFPPMPSRGTLEAYARGLEQNKKGDAAGALTLLGGAAQEANQFAPAILGYASALRRSADSRALPTLMWAQAVARESGDRHTQIRAILERAYLAYPDAAQEPLLQEALALARTSGDKDLQATLLNELGVYLTGKGNRAEAKQQLLSAQALAAGHGSRWVRHNILVNLANLVIADGKPLEARLLYQELIANADVLEDWAHIAVSRNNLAILDFNAGRAADAERVWEEVRQVRAAHGDAPGECRVLLNLGIVAFMQGHFDQAQARLRLALEGSRKLGEVQTQGRVLYRLGDIQRAQGKLPQATVSLLEARVLLSRLGNPSNQADVLAALAECKARQREFGEAERLLEEARSLAKGDRPQIWRSRAWLQHLRGQHREAQASLAMAMADPNHDDPEHQPELRTLAATWRTSP